MGLLDVLSKPGISALQQRRNRFALLADSAPVGSVGLLGGLQQDNTRPRPAQVVADWIKTRPLAYALRGDLLHTFAAPGTPLERVLMGTATERDIMDAAYNAAMNTNVVTTFGGVNAKTANKELLGKAKDMLRAEVDPRQVYADTGWFRGVDDKWRFEIDDSAAKVVQNYGDDVSNKLAEGWTQNVPLGQAYQHDDLYKAYPELLENKAYLNPKSLGSAYQGVNPITRKGQTFIHPQESADIWAHEQQHAIQDLENFAQGGAAETLGEVDAYTRMAGEVEARLVQARLNMTPAERAASYPPDMYDVPAKKQTVDFNPIRQRLLGRHAKILKRK